MDAPNHLLALKVMRVSRPSLANSWQPFFTSSPSLSAHATESIISLQGKTPLSGHPKTLRDLSHASQLLTLPSAFGAIQLGETFTSCLCVNNEANVEVEGVSLRVEMQTATNKALLVDIGGPDMHLAPAAVLETVVTHEMKELGQHVLACHVSYRLPSSVRHQPSSTSDGVDPLVQTFRKYYKFVVTNPLSVKTKVHAPRSPTSLLSSVEREKIFLEIHVQNMTQEPMWFERIRFECVEAWTAIDGNTSLKSGENIFAGSLAIMHPQDVRQYVYILTPKTVPTFPISHLPGTVIPLGRLDLSWRSPFGEPGRLLTSLLTRRIPITPPQPQQLPPSAIPPHMQPTRPRSPQLSSSRPTTPPPGSTTGFKPRPPSQIIRPQSPASIALPTTVSGPPDVSLDLIVISSPGAQVQLEKPFEVTFRVTVSALLPVAKMRLLHLVVQHLQPVRGQSTQSDLNHPTLQTIQNGSSPRASMDIGVPRPYIPRSHSTRQDSVEMTPESASPTMSPKRGMFNFNASISQVFGESPTLANHGANSMVSEAGSGTISGVNVLRLPPPFSSSVTQRNILPLGTSTISLPPIYLSASLPTPTPEGLATVPNPRGEASQEFCCSFLPIRKALTSIGGLRILLVEDREVDKMVENDDEAFLIPHSDAEAKTLREWDVIGEVWVTD